MPQLVPHSTIHNHDTATVYIQRYNDTTTQLHSMIQNDSIVCSILYTILQYSVVLLLHYSIECLILTLIAALMIIRYSLRYATEEDVR